jgi:hypothetical protein
MNLAALCQTGSEKARMAGFFKGANAAKPALRPA